jgi:hypothetical protein
MGPNRSADENAIADSGLINPPFQDSDHIYAIQH